MAVCTRNDVGKRLCEVLGIDPSMIRAIDIHVGIDEAVLMVKREYMTKDQFDATENMIIEEYELHKKV